MQSRPEPPQQRVISRERLLERVLDDLETLFNATAPTDAIALADYPEVGGSVLCFGLPPLGGKTASTVDPLQLQDRIRAAVVAFEPRIAEDSLTVQAVSGEEQPDQGNRIGIRISGRLWSHPMPLELLLQTDIDLETGEVAVRDLGA